MANLANSTALAGSEISALEPAGFVLKKVCFTPLGLTNPVLREISLNISPGEKILLTGPSGSGKSSLLKILGDLSEHLPGEFSGSAELPAQQPALLLQNPLHSFIADKAEREIVFGPENQALSRATIKERATSAIKDASFDSPLTRDLQHLSGGQQQRLSLAAALALSPQFILLDEPTAMLDKPTAQAVVAGVIGATGERGLIVAEHDIERWLPHVERVIALNRSGEITFDGSAKDFRLETIATQEAKSAGANNAANNAAVLQVDNALIAPAKTAAALALTPISFTARSGELTVITGPSGSGKSTLLRTILGLQPAVSGAVTVLPPAGEPRDGAANNATQRTFSWLPQNPEHYFITNTALAEVKQSLPAPLPDADKSARLMPADNQSAEVDAATETARKILGQVGLAKREKSNPFSLSGGEQRRLAFASALAAAPRILVLDEPTVGLDQRSFNQVAELIDLAKQQGMAVIAATHDQRLTAQAEQQVPLEVLAHQPDAEIPRRKVFVDRFNPLTLLLIGLCALLGAFTISSVPVGLISVAAILLLAPLSIRSKTIGAWIFVPAFISALTMGWSNLLLSKYGFGTPEAWAAAIAQATRMLYMTLGGVLAFVGINPFQLADALGQKLKAPAKPVLAASAAISTTARLIYVWQILAQQREIRGLKPIRDWRHPIHFLRSGLRYISSLSFALLLSALRSASLQALAMDARGFRQAQSRTWYFNSVFHRIDYLGLLLAVLVLLLPSILGIWL